MAGQTVLHMQGVNKLGDKMSESKCALVYGQMNEPPGARARVALTGLTVAEYFRDQMGQDVLFFVDNIFRFTQVPSLADLERSACMETPMPSEQALTGLPLTSCLHMPGLAALACLGA